MHRATRTAILLAVTCGALIASMNGSALAASAGGTLTSAEYKQLSDATAALDRSASARSVNWPRARAACRFMGGATRLLQTQRASCLNSVDALEALAQFPFEQARCAAAATHGTTTGTTTTATSSTPAQSRVIRMIICLSPHYQALERYAKAIYSSDSAARKQVLVRGFTGACLATLASTAADLRQEKAFAAAAARLAGDVRLLIRVTNGKVPPSDLNQIRIDTDVARFESSARAVLGEHGPQKLSACPHQ